LAKTGKSSTIKATMKMKKTAFRYPFQDEVAFRVNYSPKIQPYIFVNMHAISRPHFTSEISTFFGYIHANPNREITLREVEETQKIKLKKGMDDILRDLGFRGELARIFFKKMTNNAVHFTNPVRHCDLEELNIDLIDIYKTVFSPKRKKAIFPTN